MKPLGPDSFNEATNGYRAWLGARITITDEAWAERQGVIAKCSPFEFLRATFYRWAQWWPAVCHHLSDGRHPNLDHAPQVLVSATCTSRTSGPGGMPKAASCGGSTISTRRVACPTRTISFAWPRALGSQSKSGTMRRAMHLDVPVSGPSVHACRRGRPRVSRCLPFASVRLWRCHRSPRREGRSPAVHPRGRRTNGVAAGHRDQQAANQGR